MEYGCNNKKCGYFPLGFALLILQVAAPFVILGPFSMHVQKIDLSEGGTLAKRGQWKVQVVILVTHRGPLRASSTKSGTKGMRHNKVWPFGDS